MDFRPIDGVTERGQPFPPEIISHAVWICRRFTPSFRDAAVLLAERGVIAFYGAVRIRWRKFGPVRARSLRHRHGQLGDVWHVDGLFIRILRFRISYLAL